MTREEEIIIEVKNMVSNYNEIHQYISDDDKLAVIKAVIKSVSKMEFASFSDFMYKCLRIKQEHNKKYILTIDEILDSENIVLRNLSLLEKKAKDVPQEIGKKFIKMYTKGIEAIKKMRQDEVMFFLLIKRKISERIQNKTIYTENISLMEKSIWKKVEVIRVEHAIKDIELEYRATNICVSERYQLSEKARIEKAYSKLAEAQSNELKKLIQFKIDMIDAALNSSSKKEHVNENVRLSNHVKYKQCNDCGAWHNAKYNRCAPCNNFTAIND